MQEEYKEIIEDDLQEEEDLGTPEERERILCALREWANSQRDEVVFYIPGIDTRLTAGELISHIEDETAIGVALLDSVVIEAKKSEKITSSKIVRFYGREFPLAIHSSACE